jgi:xylan 1,4-beta-xylosidase
MRFLLPLVLGLLAAAEPLVLRCEAGRAGAPLPAALRPSLMLSWADADAVRLALRPPAAWGALRATVETQLADSRDAEDYRQRLAAAAAGLAGVAAGEAELVVTVARMPAWLSRRHGAGARDPASGFSAREAAPSDDLAGLERLGEDTVRLVGARWGRRPWFEFWNEPDLEGFWSGDAAELARCHAAFARGARRADPQARVGGPGVSCVGSQRTLGQPFLRAWLRDLAAERETPAFVSWHNFAPTPGAGWDGAAQVRAWLAEAGLPAATPQVVSEWNRWAAAGGGRDPAREDAVGAAHLVAALPAIAAAGIRLHTVATLQDFAGWSGDAAFTGDFGLVTKPPLLAKAPFHAWRLAARLEGGQVAVACPPAAARAGVAALAARARGTLRVLLARCDDRPGAEAGIALRLEPAGMPAGSWSSELVDAGHGDPAAAYRAARQAGIAPAAALAVARAASPALRQGGAELGDVTLGRHAVCLLTVQAGVAGAGAGAAGAGGAR